MDIDQHLIVKTIDAVVERSVVKADMYAEGHALGVVAQYRRYTTSDSSADLMFSIARYQLLPLRITEEQSNPRPSFRLGDERWNPVRVFFGQEQAGEREQIDIPAGRPERFRSLLTWHVVPAWVAGDEFRSHQGSVIDGLRPEIRLVFLKNRSNSIASLRIRHGGSLEPPADAFYADLCHVGELLDVQPGTKHGTAEAFIDHDPTFSSEDRPGNLVDRKMSSDV